MPQFIVCETDLDATRRHAVLRGAEARHCSSVVRLCPGDPMCVTDGAGHRWRGVYRMGSKELVHIDDLHPLPDNEPGLLVELLQGFPKGERWETILEKGTELGASSFRPLYTVRSIPSLSADRLDRRLRRWQEKVRGAVKQCERSCVPEVAAPQPMTRYLEQLAPVVDGELRMYLAERVPPGPWPKPPTIGTVRIAVGPEGGWTEDEKKLLSTAGFRPVSLGPRILRADTAAVAALALVMQIWGDLVLPHTEW